MAPPCVVKYEINNSIEPILPSLEQRRQRVASLMTWYCECSASFSAVLKARLHCAQRYLYACRSDTSALPNSEGGDEEEEGEDEFCCWPSPFPLSASSLLLPLFLDAAAAVLSRSIISLCRPSALTEWAWNLDRHKLKRRISYRDKTTCKCARLLNMMG